MPARLSQVGPASAPAPSAPSQMCSGGQTDSATFSSILDSIDQLLNSPLAGDAATSRGSGTSQGLFSPAPKHAIGVLNTGTSCRENAKGTGQRTALALDLPNQTNPLAPLATPTVTTLLTLASGSTTESQNETLESPVTSTVAGVTVEPLAMAIASDTAGTVIAPALVTTAARVSTSDSAPAAPVSDPAEATNSPGTLTPAGMATMATFASVASAAPQPALGNVDLAGESLSSPGSDVSTKLPAVNMPAPPNVSGSVQTPEKQQSLPVQAGNKGGGNQKQPILNLTSLKPEQPNESLAVQAHRASENLLNLGKTRTAEKTEIRPLLSPLKGGSDAVVPVSSDPTTAADPSAHNPGMVSVTSPGERLSVETQTSSSFHQNSDGSDSPKSQTDKDAPSSAIDGSTVDPSESSPIIQTTASQLGPQSSAVTAVQAVVPPTEGGNSVGNVAPKTTNRTGEPLSSATTEEHSSTSSSPYPGAVLSSARLVERVGESELRLGIRVGELGNVDIRTTMVRNQFTAEISVERNELGKALAAEMPNLQNRLSEQRIPVASIVLQSHAGGNSGTPEQQRPRQGQPMPSTSYGSNQEEKTAPLPAVSTGANETGSRLDVHL